MAVPNPEILLTLNESSGTTVTNYGSVATNPTVANGSENTDWQWNNNADELAGNWQPITETGTNHAYIDLTGITTPTALDDLWFFFDFTATAYDTTGSGWGFIAGSSNGTTDRGPIMARMSAPTSTGNFDLTLEVESSSSSHVVQNVYADLSFSTRYKIAGRFDSSTTSACVLHTKKDSDSVVSSSSFSFTGRTFRSNAGYIGKRGATSNKYSWKGNLYAWAYGHGDTLSDSDLGDLTSDPAGTITGWPGAGGGIIPQASYYYNITLE